MARVRLDKDRITEVTVKLVNEVGIEKVTLKMVADELGIQTPSLYNHIKSLDDLKKSLMIYGWKVLEHELLHSVAGVSGYDALRAMCYAFYDYATANPGVFNTMLWYNKFQDDESMGATSSLFDILYRIMESLHISQHNTEHLVRTFRSFLEGYCLLLNNGAFGNPISTKESFDVSVDVLMAGIHSLSDQ